MEVFSRLAIGTANWGKPYGLSGKQVPKEDQKDILDYCQSSGIDTIDTATAYEWDWMGASTYFKVILKITGCENVKLLGSNAWCIMAHNAEAIDLCLGAYGKYPYWGISVYEPREITTYAPNIYQVPYSIFDRRFEPYFAKLKAKGIEIHVRSIFLQGKILQKVRPHEAIAFCLMNPYVDKVIVGADSFRQLRDNLRWFHRLSEMEVHDENILDPRKWSKEPREDKTAIPIPDNTLS